MTSELRPLRFETLADAVAETQSLLDSGYQRQGNWSLGQICRHLTLVQDPSIDGYPGWMSLFAFLRPLMRRWLLPKVLSPDSPRGIRTLGAFVPPRELDDAAEVDRFGCSVERFLTHAGPLSPHPAFGRLDAATFQRVHAAHAAHHLRFLVAGENASEPSS